MADYEEAYEVGYRAGIQDALTLCQEAEQTVIANGVPDNDAVGQAMLGALSTIRAAMQVLAAGMPT